MLRLKASAPRANDKTVRSFLQMAGLASKPRFLPYRFVAEDYQVGYCLTNCAREASRSGDFIQYGWTIWRDEDADFTEAEFHAVMRRADGLEDVTPRKDGEMNILFVPDDTRQPSFEPPAAWRTWSNFKLFGDQFLPARPITIVDPSGASKP